MKKMRNTTKIAGGFKVGGDKVAGAMRTKRMNFWDVTLGYFFKYFV